jgi:hypothetical protein
MAAALVVAGCTASHQVRGTGGAASPSASPASLAAYYQQKLDWQACSGGFECARLLVPVNYSAPAGARFSLPVIRLRASGPAKRIGSIVVNPGGPGGSGVDYAKQARSALSAAVRGSTWSGLTQGESGGAGRRYGA